jgi:membrane protein implicated in regulation of membrane protease activity
MPWWGWAVGAAVIGLAELQVPGSYLIWIALGAALTAAMCAALPASLELQLATFAVAAAASCCAGYFVYRRVDPRRPTEGRLNERGLSMVGMRGIVCDRIENGQGKVRLGDSTWLAEGPSLDEGTPIVVHAVRGTRVLVEPVSSRPREAAGGP